MLLFVKNKKYPINKSRWEHITYEYLVYYVSRDITGTEISAQTTR